MAGFEATPPHPETAATPAAERTALQHVGAHITRAIAEGMDRLTLHLVPAELGRIDITLDVREDGQVKTTVRADNPTTLDLLQRDSRNLERALESAGLRAEAGSLNFSLRNDGRQNQPFSPFQHDETNDGVAVEDGIAVLPASPVRSAARGLVDLTI
jgi:flagellar hook-length control protein FliK